MLAVYEELNKAKLKALIDLRHDMQTGNSILTSLSKFMVSNMGFNQSQINTLRKVPVTLPIEQKPDISCSDTERMLVLGFPELMHYQVVQQATLIKLGYQFSNVRVTSDLNLSFDICGQNYIMNVKAGNLEITNISGNKIVNYKAVTESDKNLLEHIEFNLPKFTGTESLLDGRKGLFSAVEMTFLEQLENDLVNLSHFDGIGALVYDSIGLEHGNFPKELRLLMSLANVSSHTTEYINSDVLTKDALQWLDLVTNSMLNEGIEPTNLITDYIKQFDYQLSKTWVVREMNADEYLGMLVETSTFQHLTLDKLNEIEHSEFIERLRSVKFTSNIDAAISLNIANSEAVAFSYEQESVLFNSI